YIRRRIVAFWESILQRVPLVRGIYTTIKSMMDVLSFQDQNKGAAKYSRVVMIEFPRKGQYALALVTGVTPGEVQDISTDRVVNVYVPTSLRVKASACGPSWPRCSIRRAGGRWCSTQWTWRRRSPRAMSRWSLDIRPSA